MLLECIFPYWFAERDSRCMYSETALAMNQRAVNKNDLDICLKTTLLISLKESDIWEMKRLLTEKKKTNKKSQKNQRKYWWKKYPECKDTDFRITCHPLTGNSSLGLHKPWSMLLSPSLSCSLNYTWLWRSGYLSLFTPRGKQLCGAANPCETLLEADPTVGTL